MSEIEKFKKKYSKTVEYKIITTRNINDMEKRINEEIENGYIPTGTLYKEDEEYYQAIILKHNVVLKNTCSYIM